MYFGYDFHIRKLWLENINTISLSHEVRILIKNVYVIFWKTKWLIIYFTDAVNLSLIKQ